MTAKACAWIFVLLAAGASPAWAAPCYSDGDVVTLEGTVTRQATHQTDATAKPASVLALASPVCVISETAGQGGRQQSNVSAVQIIDAELPESTRVQLTGKLVTGNVSAYYAVPTAIWVLRQRVLSGQ
ncbi:conserved exported hypothetical protein [Burkholderia sp. 8Y]|uniref:hypothetical protein n=1 Tax=Burkholderia sp. 8Y TaxID=2653133 RepID=UPI0012EF95EF|nr:hypothetical protein [Burkholderia sp. 8Y]VXC73587.1 conserved exported hypothetical protein [Burkholderia sp. 8Y]